MASTSTKVFSLQGKSLKLDSRSDIEPHLENVDPAVVEEIHLGGNTIGVEAAKALAEFLEKTTVLKVADFADIFTGRLITEIPPALSAICDALRDKTSLVELDLSDNAFGSRSVDPIVPFLKHNRSFQIFKLNNNGLGPEGGTVIANALAESAKLSKKEGKPSQLRTLICGRNRLQDGSSEAWAEAFAAHGSLVEVRMPQNGIRMDGIANLAHGLARCPNLEYLDLQDNTFGEVGSVAMADALSVWTELTFLNFSDCVLSNEGEGVSAITETIANGSNPKLQTLQLQNNNMETDSFALLAEGISKLPSLKRLELQWNEVDDDEDENLQTLVQSLKQRGGKAFLNDEEEEEEEEFVAGGAEAEGKDEDAARTSAAVDELADLLVKTKIA
ncbi:hypothetical protein BJ322DRAFT_1014467 [Thelephora terrestris]|uniref:RNI-like protein n=1 Tax=Thelephora terrestris TaxID=56493 RepID=A0A9P6H3K1_9AGAM|nr:hypothetical protein BJ322DRAFT_1014467 [Thelephora terrestris]